MKIFINNYLNYISGSHLETGDFPGPVVTISREAGCSAQRIAIKLSKILTGYSYMSETKTDANWKWVGKEVMREAIIEMDAEGANENVEYDTLYKQQLKEVVEAFSKESAGNIKDPKVLQAIKNVICKLAVDGRYIFVGRAANIILKNLPNKLSIKLEAPFEWRTNRVMQLKNISFSEAEEFVMAQDRQRCGFIERISGRKPTNFDFDLIFNYSSIYDDQIVDVIVNVLKNKKIISQVEEYI